MHNIRQLTSPLVQQPINTRRATSTCDTSTNQQTGPQPADLPSGRGELYYFDDNAGLRQGPAVCSCCKYTLLISLFCYQKIPKKRNGQTALDTGIIRRPTATLGTFGSRLSAHSCGTVFQLLLGKRASSMNSLSGCQDLFAWVLTVETVAHI